MKKFLASALFCGLVFSGNAALGAALSADDFLPPVQSDAPEVTEIAQPDKVKEEKGIDNKPAVRAATAQDAINAAAKNIEVGGGVQQIRFPSGFGWVASGNGVYGVMPNPVATLTAQRHAYQTAYMNAKKNLASALNELSTQGQEDLKSQIQTLINETDTLSNMSESFAENIGEQVQGLLRGYVVYNVKDEQKDGTGNVTVTIVATPKTMGKGQRIGNNGASADSIRDGVQTVLNEIQTNLMPPVGGKIVTVPETGEIAFIGFGSAVVPTNPNPAAAAKLMLNSQKMAQMRARSALCGIILGDEITATSSLDSGLKTISDQFEEAQKDDPTNENSAGDIRKLDEQRNNFVNTSLTTDQVSSVRNGVLPPGVMPKTFMNPENTMAYAIAIYMPSASAQAKQMGDEMRNSKIVQDPASSSRSSTQGGDMPAQGPSGQVMKDADL